ncbi:MAG: hypothetical protein MRY78_11715 [Saprospiraceae bacterium]|nr:hypothetical protein [Saprospiraceae bacterium]
MKIRREELNEKEQNAAQKMLDEVGSRYRSFNDYVAFRDDDSIAMMVFKLFLRFVGIIFMLLLSPFILIGLLVAIAAVA